MSVTVDASYVYMSLTCMLQTAMFIHIIVAIMLILFLNAIWLGEVNGVDLLLEKCSISISWLIITDSLTRFVCLKPCFPDIVDWISRIKDAGTARKCQ